MRVALALATLFGLIVTSYINTEETVTTNPNVAHFIAPTKIVVKVVAHDTVRTTKVVTKIKILPTTTALGTAVNTPSFIDDNIGKAARSDLAHASNNLNVLAHILNKTYCTKHKVKREVILKNQRIVDAYITTFKDCAIDNEKRNGIPASITLAQGILESGAGTSYLARNANNHFGIKCFMKSCKKGHCINASDDTHKDFFMCYENARKSYDAHSEFLKRPRYARLLKLDKCDYKAWAKGLKDCGYATAPNYAKSLVKLVEYLHLDKIK